MTLLAAACLWCAGIVSAATPPAHDHAHAAHGDGTLVLDGGKQWQTDAPLREAMVRIRDAVNGAAAAFHTGTLDKSQAAALAATIRDQVSYMVAHCKLEPRADAMLHILLGELLQGADVVEADPHSLQGMPRLVGALQDYPVYFAHPDWVPVEGH